MIKGAPNSNPAPSGRSLEEILSGIPETNRAAAQSAVERMIQEALVAAEERHNEALAAAEQRHGESMSEALAAAEQKHNEALNEALAAAEERHQLEMQALYEKLTLQRQRLYGRKSEHHLNQPAVFNEADVAAQDSTEANDQAVIPPEPSSEDPAGTAAKDQKSARIRGKRSPPLSA